VSEESTGDKSIAILLTPPGPAAIAVVRLAGPGVGQFLARYFSKKPVEGRCVHGTLADRPRVIDDPVVVLRPGGGAADVNLHGGPWVVRSVLELARRDGFDVIEGVGLPLPEEAVDAATPLAQEVVQYLPMARTELALRVLLAQEAAWDGLRNGHAGSAEADPTERPAPAWPAGRIESILADRSLCWLLHPPRVAIVGAPNVGKSTLANQLFAQERSITADVPGTTRDWVGEIANIDGLAVMLVDTPGVRQTADPIERHAIERSRDEVSRADLVVLVVDQSQLPEEQKAQRDLMNQYPFNSPQVLYVVNKADLKKIWGAFVDFQWPRTVATTCEGVDELRDAIKRRFLGPGHFAVDRPRWWTQRQRSILERALVDPTALSQICVTA
jgi:tRNA modification GTPase